MKKSEQYSVYMKFVKLTTVTYNHVRSRQESTEPILYGYKFSNATWHHTQQLEKWTQPDKQLILLRRTTCNSSRATCGPCALFTHANCIFIMQLQDGSNCDTLWYHF